MIQLEVLHVTPFTLYHSFSSQYYIETDIIVDLIGWPWPWLAYLITHGSLTKHKSVGHYLITGLIYHTCLSGLSNQTAR
jgi:hypothetical protein